MLTNQKSVELLENSIKQTRREMFRIFNILPWLLLVIILAIGNIYFYINAKGTARGTAIPVNTTVNTTVNTNVTESTNINTVANVNTNVNADIATDDKYVERYYYESKDVVIDIEGLRRLEQASIFYVEMQMELKALMYNFEQLFNKYDKGMNSGLESREKAGELITNQLTNQLGRIEEILSGIEGGKTIERKNVAREVARENVFTSRDFIMAREIGYDIEKEIIEQSLVIIDREFGRWDGSERGKLELQDRLRTNIRNTVGRIFDGFETYNRIRTGR